MRSAVRSEIKELPCSARETVECETLACLAISLMVTGIPGSFILEEDAHVCMNIHSLPSFWKKVNRFERILAKYCKMLYDLQMQAMFQSS
jgi:hypothetical protein